MCECEISKNFGLYHDLRQILSDTVTYAEPSRYVVAILKIIFMNQPMFAQKTELPKQRQVIKRDSLSLKIACIPQIYFVSFNFEMSQINPVDYLC